MNHRQYLMEHPRFGKLLGAILGFVMAGPVGAFFGIVVGNFFDQGLAQHLAKPQGSFRAERNPNTKAIFLQATFSLLGAVAKADGRVSEASIHLARRFMSELGLSKAQRTQAQVFFNQGKSSGFTSTPLLLHLKQVTAHNPTLLKLFITLQYEHVQEIGFTRAKIARLNHILSNLGFATLPNQEQTAYEPFQSQRVDPLAQAYTLLSITPNASKEEVKRAYRRLISQHHPDKISAKGASAETIKTANEKTQAITKAYEKICTSRGW